MTSLHYTTIPYSKLKGRLKELIQLCFIKMNVPGLVHFAINVPVVSVNFWLPPVVPLMYR